MKTNVQSSAIVLSPDSERLLKQSVDNNQHITTEFINHYSGSTCSACKTSNMHVGEHMCLITSTKPRKNAFIKDVSL